MATCFQIQPPRQSLEDDSVVLFSTSNSPEESTSRSSSCNPSPLQNLHNQACYKLTVTNLSYTITQRPWIPTSMKKQKTINILKSVSFSARTSEILAVVGPSGTGKSTLLRVISGRVRDKDFNPKSIKLNDNVIKIQAQLRKICGFVAQDDTLFPLLTVKETLMFSAKFRLKEMSPRERENRVEVLLQELGLTHVADGFVGDDENRGISGGERKRVSIGVDVIHDPSILILDEPTSGLDSSSALQVIELLSSMARAKKRTIVLSIHQPSYRILHYISNFLILSHGSVVHNGSLESLELTISRLGFKIPPQLNPLEFSMEIISILEESYSKNYPSEENRKEIYPSYPQLADKDTISDPFLPRMFEITVLCVRFWKIIFRTKQLLLARTMQALVGGFGLGSVYMKLRKDEGGVAERLGLFAFSLSFLLSSTVEALPIYLQERAVLMKEASRGSYRISSYIIANTLIFFPFLFIVALLFSVPLYWIVGLNPSVSSLVLFLSVISPDFISGNSLICTVLGAFFLFSGYFIPKELIPKYWIFMYYVSLYRYPLDCLIINEYWSERNECFGRRVGDNLSECLLTGRDVLKSRGLDKDTRWINVGIMLAFFVFYRVLSGIILARKVLKTTL
ncbi:Transporter, ABC superfamily (Breast cancer resistance protein) [Handroanthus impetiginosus]|uniref:Transporter, ABC superfamily (Breast cancer resistance protein) n=1 Tax=Handroanthus impetiginosus TaxID=429701 RepID=A0A2G9H2D5_9LAMI|nr:Transporter, ABC superfamily (Breast cancer resistance protein) [Handroanthus impetiginosus]